MIPVIIGVSFLVFFIMDLAPGDAVDILAPEGATAEDLEAIRHDLGLDQPVIVRYVKYMGGMLHGDMGVSYVSKTDVFDTYMEKLPATIKLSFASILVSILLSVPLGIYSATRQGTVQDNISMIVAMIGLSMPNFWLGLLLIIVFSLNLGWVPVWRRSDPVLHRTSGNYHRNRAHGYLDENDPFFYAGCFKTGVFTNRKGKGNPGKNCNHIPCLEKCADSDHHDYWNAAGRRIGRKRSYRNSICLAGSRPPDRGLSEYEGYPAGYRQHYYDNNSP